MDSPMIQRGDIVLADLDPVLGHEQGGRRPVVVVSADRLNRRKLVVMAVPGTGAERVLKDYRLNVRVTSAETGLPKDTVFLCFQARALDKRRLLDPTSGNVRFIGSMPRARMAEIDAALRLSLA